MVGTIQHRGPDSQGIWKNEKFGIALGHCRLSVLDLTNAGNQPMHSESGRWVLAYNGEIYNHLELRRQLKQEYAAPAWRGHSDTETLLACVEAWGVEKTLIACTGMFAIALWDCAERSVILARDRMGEKPLYYGWQGDSFMFASEIKALRAHPSFNAAVDRGALALLLRHNCIPSPYSIYKGISKLRPGHILRVAFDSGNSTTPASVPFWRLNDVVEYGMRNQFVGTDASAVDTLENQLSKSIKDQMLADVPLGVFLSGGVDSSAVVALMQSQSASPIKTFTIGLDEYEFNETKYANAVARYLGTDHTELIVRPEDALEVIPKIPAMYCEPFADSSQIPTFLVTQLARRHVTVALSGDGGDELFGGYNRYLMARRVWSKMHGLPLSMRKLVARTLRAHPANTWEALIGAVSPLLPKRLRLANPGYKALKLADVLTLSDDHEYFFQLVSHWNDPASIIIGGCEPDSLLTNQTHWPQTDCFEHWMMAMDAQTYLPDDILVKVDRAAMATSLETRMPMLDHRVIELAWSMPLHLKIRKGQGKWLLRQVLYRHIPKDLIERPKMGFGIPLSSWLRGPLREWAEELVSEQRLRSEGFFHPAPIRAMWIDFMNRKGNFQYHLWTILMFQAWMAENSASRPSSSCTA